MPRTRSRSSVSASAEDSPGLREQLLRLRRVLLDERLDGAQVHAHGDQPGLRPVVQIPLDAAQFGGGGVDGVVPGLGEPLDALRQLLRRGWARAAPGEQRSGRWSGTGSPQGEPDQGRAEAGRPARPCRSLSTGTNPYQYVVAERRATGPPPGRRALHRVGDQRGREERGDEARAVMSASSQRRSRQVAGSFSISVQRST